jgi:uncharacterized protein (DUF983 family)
MAEVVPNAQQDFWQAPALHQEVLAVANPVPARGVAEMCARCGSEFMIGARFCHSCGSNRPSMNSAASADASALAGFWTAGVLRLQSAVARIPWRKLSPPSWLHYLHFHEIKRWIGLPTASLVAFITGLGCVMGMLGVSLFYKASNLAEFQAIQMWRIEWLLGATAAFVAGILLKKPSDINRD